MFYNIVKRSIDIFGSLFLLVLFSPILVASAVAMRLDSKGPIFAETPKRVGRKGKLFYAYKLRTMIPNAYKLLRTDPKYKKAFKEQQEGGNYKIHEDPRITKVGRVLRRHSVDEVPQLLNVLKGEMSIVGPRPYYKDELIKQQKLFPGTEELVREVIQTKPGITGFWQVSGRSEVAFDRRIEMDAYYARKRSILLDILILIKTPWVMLTGKGAL